MSRDEELRDGDESLRAAWRGRPAGPAPAEGCPPASDLWSAVRGDLPVEARRAVVDHTSSCAACAEAWQLAVAVNPDPIPVAPPAPRAGLALFPRPAAFAPLAAAATLVVALATGFWLLPRPGRTPEFRGAEAAVIRSLLGDGQALPRGSFRLLWSAGPAGSRYDVHVTTESLQVVASVRGLAEPALVVPESALIPLPAGTRLLWRVEAVLPDGERVASATFAARLE